MRAALLLLAACASAGRPELGDDAPPGIDAPIPIDAPPRSDAAIDAPMPITVTLSETQAQLVLPSPHTVMCNNGTETAENHYYRVFPLTSFGISSAFHTQRVDFGTELVTGAPQIATVNVGTYAGAVTTTTMALDPTLATTIASTNAVMPVSASAQAITAPITVTIPAGGSVYVEVVTPSELGTGRAAVLGSNETTETLPSFTSSPDTDCMNLTPSSFAAIGFPKVHLVLTVTGDHT